MILLEHRKSKENLQKKLIELFAILSSAKTARNKAQECCTCSAVEVYILQGKSRNASYQEIMKIMNMSWFFFLVII